jgi:murein DD-endopeptidase MepM/ murein hydrolase activator NlpD
MDNYFYDRNTTGIRNKSKEKQKNIMARVVVVQLVLSLVISGILFAICRTDSNLSNEIKSFYNEICEKDIATSSIIDVFKNVVKQTFAPIIQYEETTKDAVGETNEESGEKVIFSPVFLTVKLNNPIRGGVLSSTFGYRISPITNEYSLHKGLDIAIEKNAKIYAAYDGVVIKSEYNYMNGNYIVLEHSDSLKTTYNHCNKLLVKTGDKVKKGEYIALVGATGYATGDHLHYEVIVNGKYINPVWVLDYGI